MERTRSRQVQALWMTITFFAVVSCNSKTEEPEQSSEPQRKILLPVRLAKRALR